MRYVNDKTPFLLLIPVAIFYSLTLSTNWKPTWDSATYIMLGKSLIEGDGFKYMDIPHTKYPFMFPLMLSPIIGLFGRNFFLMQFLIVLMALGSVALTYWFFRQSAGVWFGIAIMLMTAASFPLLMECTRILSDIPYMFLSLLSLLFIKRYARDEGWRGRSGYAAGLVMLAAFFTRYVGLALFAGTFLYLLLDSFGGFSLRLRKVGFICLIFLIPASAWMVRGAVLRKTHPPPPGLREFLSYEKELVVQNPSDPHTESVNLSGLVNRMRVNGVYYQQMAADIVRGRQVKVRWQVVALSTILLCGFIYSLIRWRDIFEYYVFFYVLIYILWTSLQGHRFFVPIIPFIFYYLVRALWMISDLLRMFIKSMRGRHWILLGKRVVTVALALFFVYLNWSSDVGIIRSQRRSPYYTGSAAHFLNSIGWVKENTPPDSVIVSGRAPWVYMLSDRKAFSPPWVNNPEEVMTSIHENGTDYVINSPVLISSSFISPVLKDRSDSFVKVYETGDCAVYSVLEEKKGQ